MTAATVERSRVVTAMLTLSSFLTTLVRTGTTVLMCQYNGTSPTSDPMTKNTWRMNGVGRPEEGAAAFEWEKRIGWARGRGRGRVQGFTPNPAPCRSP